MSEAAATLTPFACSGCKAPLVVPAGDAATCATCGASTPVPADYREARALARGADGELRRAGREWQRYARATLSGGVARTALSLAPLLVLGGLGGLLAIALSDEKMLTRLPALAAYAVWMPLLPLVFLGHFAAVRSVRREQLALARARLTARAGASASAPLCRRCDAPLDATGADPFARCLHCHTDNLLPATADAPIPEAVRATVSASEAMALLHDRADQARSFASVATVLCAALLGPALAWSFSTAIRDDWWPAITVDLGLLALVVLLLPCIAAFFTSKDFRAERDKASVASDGSARPRRATFLVLAALAGAAFASVCAATVVYRVAGLR